MWEILQKINKSENKNFKSLILIEETKANKS
jgi:hypothetical protein